MGPLYLALLSEQFEGGLLVLPMFLYTVQSCGMERSLCTREEAVSAPPLSLACVCPQLHYILMHHLKYKQNQPEPGK